MIFIGPPNLNNVHYMRRIHICQVYPLHLKNLYFFSKSILTFSSSTDIITKLSEIYIRKPYGGVAHLGERLHGMQEVRGSIPLISTTNSPHPSGCGLLLYVHTEWYRLRCRVIKTALLPGACKTPRAFTPAGRYQRSRAASRVGRERPASPLPHPITRQCLSARLRTSQPSAVTRTRSSTRTPISPGR